jgi:hypothetical protein
MTDAKSSMEDSGGSQNHTGEVMHKQTWSRYPGCVIVEGDTKPTEGGTLMMGPFGDGDEDD